MHQRRGLGSTRAATATQHGARQGLELPVYHRPELDVRSGPASQEIRDPLLHVQLSIPPGLEGQGARAQPPIGVWYLPPGGNR